MVTKSIHSELLFNLSATRNITQTFKELGLQKNTEYLLLCLFNASQEEIESASKLVNGSELEISQLEHKFSKNAIVRHYGLTPFEQQDIEKAIVNKISTKE